jgi:hypothetical protein
VSETGVGASAFDATVEIVEFDEEEREEKEEAENE